MSRFPALPLFQLMAGLLHVGSRRGENMHPD